MSAANTENHCRTNQTTGRLRGARARATIRKFCSYQGNFQSRSSQARNLEAEVQAILQQMESSKPRVRLGFEKGQNVRITDGPFVDFMGAVDEVYPDRSKVKILVSFFGRETPVELDFLQVEKS